MGQVPCEVSAESKYKNNNIKNLKLNSRILYYIILYYIILYRYIVEHISKNYVHVMYYRC